MGKSFAGILHSHLIVEFDHRKIVGRNSVVSRMVSLNCGLQMIFGLEWNTIQWAFGVRHAQVCHAVANELSYFTGNWKSETIDRRNRK